MPAEKHVPSSSDGSIVDLALRLYLKKLRERPLMTKALTAAAIAGLSDVVAQQLSRTSQLNWRRTLAMAVFGLVWSGPSNHHWQQFVERLFKGSRDDTTVVKKVVLDQLTYGPVCNLMFMSYFALVVEGRTLRWLSQKIRTDYLSVQLQGWKLWPLAAFINYRYVPLQLRVLFTNVIAFLWSLYLNMRARSSPLLVIRIKAA